ncbi:hypothetical protein O1L55_40260 [Streptomyces albulus]|nr:hypothetical protein [Streptomyces noursei]
MSTVTVSCAPSKSACWLMVSQANVTGSSVTGVRSSLSTTRAFSGWAKVPW